MAWNYVFYLFHMCLIRDILHVYDYIAFLLKIVIEFDLKLDVFFVSFCAWMVWSYVFYLFRMRLIREIYIVMNVYCEYKFQ